MDSSPVMQPSCDTLKATCTEEDRFSKYRSLDGSCNHGSDRDLGQSFTSYGRLLFPAYLDGIQEFRRSTNRRHALPSAREVSNKLVKNVDAADKELTLAAMQWGQFVGQDMAHTAESKMGELSEGPLGFGERLGIIRGAVVGSCVFELRSADF